MYMYISLVYELGDGNLDLFWEGYISTPEMKNGTPRQLILSFEEFYYPKGDNRG